MCHLPELFMNILGLNAHPPPDYKKLDPEISPEGARALESTLLSLTSLNPTNFTRPADLKKELQTRFSCLKNFRIDGNNEQLVQQKLVESARKSEVIRKYYEDHVEKLNGDSQSLKNIAIRLIYVVPSQ